MSASRDGTFGVPEFGLLDNLSYSYDGPRLARVSQNMEGSEFYGRTGIAAKGSSYGWNDAGLMTADLGAGITDIRYSHLGQPVTVLFGSGEETLDMTYTAAGEPVSRRHAISGRRGSVWTTIYTAGREFYSTEGALQSLNPYISYFPGGFFDGNGGVHYLHTDHQGSVMMQTGADGQVEEHTAYYPYGEMWSLPTMRGIDNAPHVTQPRHYQGKERIAATGDTDFGPRWHNTAAAMWRAPDLKAADYPNISPYTFCAANPIRYADPTGLNIYRMDEKAQITSVELTTEYDQIIIMDKNNEILKQSEKYKNGTIREVGNDGKELSDNGSNFDGKTRFKVTDHAIGDEVFKFLSDNITHNSHVEISILSGYSSDGDIFSIIGSSYEVAKETSAIDILNKTQEGTIYTEYFHSHPLSNDMSGDSAHFVQMIGAIESRRSIPPQYYGIYFTGSKQKPNKLLKNNSFYLWKDLHRK